MTPNRLPTSSTDRQRTKTRLTVLTITALLLIAGAVVAIWAGNRSSNDGATGGGTADHAMTHVHGLGVDPADGMLYAATHNGLFRLPQGGPPQRVSELQQDTMGFTIAGPKHFLGSGHPDPQLTDAPANLGLIESTDGGRSWRPLSLSGQVDFHSLEAKHGRVYGYSSTTGEFMVSADRASWHKRAPVVMADFSVSPTLANELLATTEQGPVRSTDGGMTFTLIPDAPLLHFLDWVEHATVYAVDPQGRAFVSPDGGKTWEARAQLDSTPQATAVAADSWYVATQSGVMVSTNGGQTFQVRTPLD